MLLGSFVEAHQVQQGQPVQIAASNAVVLALLEYIYGGQLQVELEDSLELLPLADAYGFPELAAMIEAELCTALESASVATALKFLRHARDLRELTAKCEKKIATNFETCTDMVDFLELSTGQLGRILRRNDLNVPHEEVVVKGLFNWFNRSKDRGPCLGALLHHIDFQCLSSSNLIRLQQLSASIGPVGHDLQQEIGDALEVHKKRSAEKTLDAIRPKRTCLQNWSPELGASAQAPQKVLPFATSMCWHDGAIYCATFEHPHHSRILRWKPGDAESQVIAGRGARVNGVNALGRTCEVCVSPEGDMFVADNDNRRLLHFQNGSGSVVLSDFDVHSVFCSPNGAVYVLAQDQRAVEKLVGATLQPVISGNDLPAELQFEAYDLFVTKDEAVYIVDQTNNRILRIKPGEAEPVVLGEAPNVESSDLGGLFVTEEEKIYVADPGQEKVWAFYPGDAAWTEVLTCPVDYVLVHGRSLYVSMGESVASRGVYEYSLPPRLDLG
eukprot:Skav223588  [mRNA]  locus=scaffold493:2233:3729:- [translate_table: standard]